MKRRLVEDIKRQQKLMNIEEQSFSSEKRPSFFDVEKFMKGSSTPQDATFVSVDTKIPQVSPGSFEEITDKVISALEGGYYHPNMNKGAMGNSGETMMGIDRRHGGDINTSPDGIEFWKIIDDAEASSNWKHNYMGGTLEPKLRSLVDKMMKPFFLKNMNNYLSPEARKIVESNPNLMFHFVYSTWNGPGWFRKFATKINDAVKKGITDPNKLIEIAIRSRIDSGNSIIAQGGKKIDNILGTNVA
jgi:hypothetical protein